MNESGPGAVDAAPARATPNVQELPCIILPRIPVIPLTEEISCSLYEAADKLAWAAHLTVDLPTAQQLEELAYLSELISFLECLAADISELE